MDGKTYTKEIEIKDKRVALITVVTVIGIALAYLVFAMGGVIPSNYNIVDIIHGGNGNTNQNSSGEQITYPPLPPLKLPPVSVSVYGIPQEVNVSQYSTTTWDIDIHIDKGTANNLTLMLMPMGDLTNISISLTSQDSNWVISNAPISALYNNHISAGQDIHITLTIQVIGTLHPHEGGKIMFYFQAGNPDSSVLVNAGTLNTQITS